MVAQDIWEQFLTIVRQEVGSRVVDTWFKAVSLDHWDAEKKVVHLRAPNAFVKNWIQKHYRIVCTTHLSRLLHVDTLEVFFVESAEQAPAQVVTREVRTFVPAAKDKKNSLMAKPGFVQKRGYTNHDYSFDTFVVGPSNSLAHAAAHAVVQKPGRLYNPLFIYGRSGLGKTHLLHAIGNGIKKEYKKASVLYQTADRFVSEFINAIRFDKIHLFQKKYHLVDVLLIDDVQFISNKEQTQEAFFHIFNALYEADKQIVFSSDTYPQDMQGIAERLRSRLCWGLVTDIHTPSLEIKVAILKKKAEISGVTLSDEVAHYIAAQVNSNIRELEGALIRVSAFASLTKQAVTLDLVKKILVRHVPKLQGTIDFETIVQKVCKHYPYSLQDLRSKSRKRDVAFARHVLVYLMKKITGKSLRDIGAYMGGRNHATIMSAVNKMERYLQEHPEFQGQIRQLEQDILR